MTLGWFDNLHLLSGEDLVLGLLGAAILAVVVIPRIAHRSVVSVPPVLVAFGVLVFALPLGLNPPDPIAEGTGAELLTEMTVIIALMGAGLKIDRRIGLRAWASTWRLLAVTMPLTIAAAAVLAWWAGLPVATAVLFGAVIAPTDPVLATEVQVGAPGEGLPSEVDADGPDGLAEDEVRFALTSEAGFNDALAFPFTNLAIAMAVAGTAPAGWLGPWLAVDVFYKLGVGLLLGIVLGRLLARLLLRIPTADPHALAITGLGAVAATLVSYGLTEMAGGYGFLAVFVTALVIRDFERAHEYQRTLHLVAELAEQTATAAVLILLGGAVAGGILGALNWSLAAVAVAAVALVRPGAGLVGLLGFGRLDRRERLTVAFFGIRGVGSLFYLAHALNAANFPAAEELWAVSVLTILISIVIHGVTAGPAMRAIDERRS